MIPLRAAAPSMLALLACHDTMRDQPRREPLEPAAFFSDGRATRPRVAGTIARGERERDEALWTGLVDGEPVADVPVRVDAALIARGRERYGVFCAPCHGAAGYGDGVIVARGMAPPPSFHTERLRGAPPGHVVDVITRGFGRMLDQAEATSPRDRWAIALFVRALQRSQNASLADVPDANAADLSAEDVR